MLYIKISRSCITVVLTLILTFGMFANLAAACKVLVVMKNAETYWWNPESKTGIEKVLGDRCDMTYIYLEMLENPDGVEAKVQEAYQTYQQLQPDGVIVVEDDVNSLFVVPYLKDKVDTPVVFAGLWNPEQYGYPASNVTGVLFRSFMPETVSFLKQLVPSIETVGLLARDEVQSRNALPGIKALLEETGLTVLDPVYSNQKEEIVAYVQQNISQTDAMFVPPILGTETVKAVLEVYPKPTFSAWRQSIEDGVLCGVVESGEELARLAAEKLAKAMEGTPISDIPIEAPEFGTRVVNVNTMKELGIKPSRRVLTGVELIK